MKAYNTIAACACALVFTASLFAAEKPVAQVAAAPVKAKAAPVEKMDEKAVPGDQGEGCLDVKKMIAPSSDGGVFVLVGDRLLKYDAKLNLQKEIEIKTGEEAKNVKQGKPAAEKKKAPPKK
ncbi:MAG: hypothetical protein JW768_02070 [Chitinispirillaceae bacterium]|nr:hypothetical protein [Chitinispirillaceae bacterium]